MPHESGRPPAPPLRLYLLGQVPLIDLLRLQRRLAYEAPEREGGVLVLCEHPHAISVGRQGSRFHLLPDDDELRKHGLFPRWVNRGGGVVFHQPGQLAAYLVLPLVPQGLTVADFLERWHEALLATLHEFDVPASRQEGKGGAFVGHVQVASVGVAISRWIAYHGIVLNVSNDLGTARIVAPPGPNGRPQEFGSMDSVRQRPVSMAKVREALARHVAESFGLELHDAFTHHNELARARGHHADLLRRP